MRFLSFALAIDGLASAYSVVASCKTFPGDSNWPSQPDWTAFNRTVGGRLVATVPLGAPCHGSAFDSAKCESLKSQWQTEMIQYAISHHVSRILALTPVQL